MSLKVMKKYIGTSIDDMFIQDAYIHKNMTKVSMKCNICYREKVISYRNFHNGTCTLHSQCMLLVARDDDFHSRFKGMKKRTTEYYEYKHRYIERGINSDMYKNYIDFYDDMYESYLKHVEEHGVHNTTLDRIDNNKGYFKENLRWATPKIQSNNRANSKTINAISQDGKIFSNINVTDFASEFNLTTVGIYNCVNKKWKKYKGWTFIEIFDNQTCND